MPVSQGAFASLADTAANLATTGATSLSALSSGAPALNGLQLPNEISAATALATAAQSAATGANALTIDTATPTATAGAALTATNAANAVFTANGAFADATLAIPANNVMTTANSTAAAISFTTQSSSLSSIKTSITSVQNNVNIGLSTANNALTTLTPLAAAAGVPTTTTAKDFMAVAQNAAALASSAAAQALSFQNAGNITSAQAQLTIAQQQQAIAESALAAATSILAGVGATQAVNALAGLSTDPAATLYGLANSAQEVASLATAKATTVTTQAAIVNANAPVAQYSNPAVAAPPDGFGFLVLGTKSSGTGQEGLLVANNTSQAGNNFVLDGTKNLVHVRTAEHISAEGFNYIDTATDTSASSLSRYVKFAGGTANDGFVAADKSIYLGRWQGGTMSTYSDTGLAGGNTLLESIALGASSASWMVYVNPTSNLVPRLVGTSNYTLVAATKPTDSFGNVGTLNSASISANFSAQTVSANLNLSFTGVRTLALTAQTPDVPIYANGFLSGPGADFVPTVNCVGAGCTVGSVSSWGAVIDGGFAVANASGAGLAYRFVPNLGIAPANTPYSDQIQGVAALSATAPTVGTNPVAVGATGNFRAQLLYPLTSGGATFLGGINGLTYANTALTRDSLGNLVRVTGAPWNVFSVTDSAQCTGLVTQCLNTSASNANTTAYVSMGGGTVGSLGIGFNANGDKVGTATLTETYNDTANGISFGRYQGGMVNASTVTGTFSDVLTNLGSNSVVWSTREVPASIPVSGVFHYVPTFATAPVDSLGNVGTLNRARLDVNFATQKVNPEVSVSMSSNMSLRAWAQDVPLSANFGFDVSSGASNASNSPASLLPLTVSCVGSDCAPPPVGSGEKYGYGGRINGGLAGDATANGAFFRYAFNTFYSVDAAVGTTGGIPSGTQAATTIANNYINGMVGFNKGPAAEPANGAVYSTAFFAWPYNATSTPVNLSSPLGGNDTFQTNTLLQGSGTVDANGNLLSVTEYSPGNANPQFLTLNGAPTPVSLTPTTTANGISFGRYNGQTVAQGQAGTGSALTLDGSLYTLGTFGASSSSPTTLAKSVVGALQWIRGPELWPFYVSSILQGTATYSMLAASPATDQNGFSSGTALGGGTATFGINFDKQQVNLTLSNIVVPANADSQVRTWNATTGTNGIALGGDGSFSAYTSSPGASTYFDRTLNVTMATTTCTPVSCAVDSSPQAAYGSVSGSLTGSGGSGTSASGAMLAYAFVANDVNNSYSREQVNGVAAFGTPTFSNASYPNTSALATQPYQIRIRTAGTISGTDANTGALRSTLGDLAFNVNNKYLTTVFGEVIDPGSIKYNDSAQPVAWDGAGIVVSGSTCGSPSSNCHTADIPTYTSVSGSAITTAAGFNVPAVASPASIADFGRDPTTGASWGRYTGGNMVSIDRITGLQLNGGEHSAGNTRHFLYSGIQSGPTVLPISGTVTYTFVGGTNPTDNATSGNFVGTLNSATLAANFTAKTVDIGVNAAVNGNNWVASATGVAIQKGLYFEASRSQGSGPLNLTCTGTCAGSTLSGQVAGAFVGTTGQGAGIAYSFNASTLSGSSISTLGQTIAGVAVFKR